MSQTVTERESWILDNAEKGVKDVVENAKQIEPGTHPDIMSPYSTDPYYPFSFFTLNPNPNPNPLVPDGPLPPI